MAVKSTQLVAATERAGEKRVDFPHRCSVPAWRAQERSSSDVVVSLRQIAQLHISFTCAVYGLSCMFWTHRGSSKNGSSIINCITRRQGKQGQSGGQRQCVRKPWNMRGGTLVSVWQFQ